MTSQGKQDAKAGNSLNMHWIGGWGGSSCGGLDPPYRASWFECLNWWCHILSKKAENICHLHNGTFFGDQGKYPSWSRMTQMRNRLKASVFYCGWGWNQGECFYSLKFLCFDLSFQWQRKGCPGFFIPLPRYGEKGERERGGAWKLPKHQTSC